MPITATYTPAQFKLSVIGTLVAELMTVSRNPAGTLLVNGGGVPVSGGTPTVANTSLIEMIGDAGNDTITLDEANGALPAGELSGGAGDDTITGGSAGDTLTGEAGNDTLLGKGGFDLLFGGIDNDTLTGGDGDDQMFGEDGNDRLIWNPGDDSDLMEGGTGSDTVEVNGGNGAETFTITANGTRVRFDRVTPAPFALDIGTSETLVLNANGGDDTISTSGNLAALISLTIDGGAGNDTILGGNGSDTLLGGDGNDFIDGNQGNDVAFLGVGTDTFQWDPGDGSDVVEGQGDTDTLLFNASAANELLTFTANGARLLFTRNVGNIVMDLNDVEAFTINALGGTDTVTLNDLTGTDAATVAINLSGTIGGTAGDGAVDLVAVNGSAGANAITITGAGTSASVAGLASTVAVTSAEGANDSLTVNGLGDDDSITATTLPAGVIKLLLDGGAGNDTIMGSQGADTIVGGDGNDFVFGDNGNDTAFLGANDDVFEWAPGDGNDVIEGQAGLDELLFNGSNANETYTIAANGGRATLFRDVASVTMDMDDVETITIRAVGGADTFQIGDLTGTDVGEVAVRLGVVVGTGEDAVVSGDGAADTVVVTSTNAVDNITLFSFGGVVTATGSAATVTIFGAEAANDTLLVNLGGGDDVANGSALAADQIQLAINAGLGNDLVIGSQGDDAVIGGDGNDTALLGAGDDSFVWNPGDDNDIVEGQDGTDTLVFNGANIAETITIQANGGRVRFFRDIASVTMDLDGTETIRFGALGGIDRITVEDLSGTDAKSLIFDLASTLGGAAGDAQADRVTLNGSADGEAIVATASGGGTITVTGLPADATLLQVEAADTLTILGGSGDDSISALSVEGSVAVVSLDGGEGNDTLVSSGEGTYLGGTGDDTIVAGLTSAPEILDGGADVDTLDTTSWDGTYVVNLVTGVTNFGDESFTNFENVITGDGSDTITGTTGDNVIASNGGVDTLTGDAGQDWLQGGDDADTVLGGNGNDSVWGDGGDDLLVGGVGDDTLSGGAGFDTADYSGLGVRVEIDLSWLEEQDTRGAGWDTLSSVEGVIGSAAGDLLRGDDGANRLTGGGGADELAGRGGNDVFVYLLIGDSTLVAADLVTDFAAGDKLDLSAIDADTASGGNQAFHVGATAGHTGDVVLAYDAGSDTTSVSLFVNADAVADALIRLSGNHLGLGAADFVL